MEKANEQLQKDVSELKEKVLYLTEILEKAGLIGFIENERAVNMRLARE
ncbi:MAG: hypothetical protein K0R54_3513 [Clostridiaceae bacterium]|nr:hypothetical protein [Clostridiaceae bacterium]